MRAEWALWALAAAVCLGCGGSDLVLPSDASPIGVAGSAPNPSDVGRAVRFTVVMPAGGDSTFRIATSTGESCAGDQSHRACEIVFNSPGDRTVTASSGGLTSAPVTQHVNDVTGATRTVFGTGPDPARAGQRVTLYITVTGADRSPANGIVNVFGPQTLACGNGPLIGTAELDKNGKAQLTTSSLPVGFLVLRACYTGAPGFAPSEDLATETITAASSGGTGSSTGNGSSTGSGGGTGGSATGGAGADQGNGHGHGHGQGHGGGHGHD